jgi:hypothetical protein
MYLVLAQQYQGIAPATAIVLSLLLGLGLLGNLFERYRNR